MQDRIRIENLGEHIGKSVTIAGYVDIRRDHGKLIFMDLRDESGVVQVVAKADVLGDAKEARNEWVLQITGTVKERPEKLVNADEPLGHVEFAAESIVVLSQAATPPLEVNKDTSEVGEDVRMKYRYVDLRSERMQRNMRVRSEFVQRCREHLFRHNFTEIETPLLTKATPEGSRDFLVPSRLNPGNFYALPQSPQQYKQLLMGSGFENYFQVARAVRDEDLRADRGFEHTQIDMEMAYVTQEMVMNRVEAMLIDAAEAMGKTIKQKPFPRIPYAEAMEKYGDDKFDLRTEDEKEAGVLAYAWVVDFPFFEKTDDGKWTFTHNPFSMPKPEHLDWLMNGENIEQIMTQQYDIICNGYESGGGSIRAHKPEILAAVYKVMGYSESEIYESIGHMLEAFTYGFPPHGGIALGVERNVMNLTGEKYLREVQAFPMTGSGRTSVMDAPNEASPEQLAELGLAVTKPKHDN